MPLILPVLGEVTRNASSKVLKRELKEPYWAGKDR
jgi:acyl-CoA synthetase (AMP-forming)/AMP-acid ligase II